MDYKFAKKVNVLGTEYTIELKSRKEDDGLRGRHSSAYGYCDMMEKRIVIHDLSREEEFDEEECEKKKNTIIEWARKVLRHEIVHAFFAESGLHKETKFCGNWAVNEEMIDWIAMQGPKITYAWVEAGAMT